jgi:hypothetical protein
VGWIGERQEPAAYPGKLARLMPNFHQAEEQSSSARDYRLSPRRVAMWSSVAAVAAVVALIAVAVINEADALNTVALYLAVIAFVAQLIMYVAQNESSARQLKQSQDVQRQTSMMLSAIQEQAGGMQRSLDEQFGVVINALVERAAEATEERLPRGEDGQRDGAGPVAPTLTQDALDELRDDLRSEFAETVAEVMEANAAQWRIPASTASGSPISGDRLLERYGIAVVPDRRAAMRRAQLRREQEDAVRRKERDVLGEQPGDDDAPKG